MLQALRFFDYGIYLVRAIEIDDEVWFVAKDVCNILEMTVEATRQLDNDEKGLMKIQTPDGIYEMTVINESGLHKLSFRSHKPQAKKFTKWVTHEVIPSIVRTYFDPDEPQIDNESPLQTWKRHILDRLKELEKEFDKELDTQSPRKTCGTSITAFMS